MQGPKGLQEHSWHLLQGLQLLWAWPCPAAPGPWVLELCRDPPGLWDPDPWLTLFCSCPTARGSGALGWWPVGQHTKVSASSQAWGMSVVGLLVFFKQTQPGVPWALQWVPCVTLCDIQHCVTPRVPPWGSRPLLGALHSHICIWWILKIIWHQELIICLQMQPLPKHSPPSPVL